MRSRHTVASTVLAALVASVGAVATAAPAYAADVVVDGQTRALTGTNVTRTTDALVLYTPAKGASTGTNQYGFEAAVVDCKVSQIADGVGNMAIPSNGAVLSGHGASRTWLKTYAKVGVPVKLPGTTCDGGTTPPPAEDPAATSVTSNGQTRALNGTNIYRSKDYLVRYTPTYGASTKTNQYGVEATVVGGKVTSLVKGVGNAAIPSNGYVLSGHGTSATWLSANATVGKVVTLGDGTSEPPPSTATEKLPDIVLRTLDTSQMKIVYGPSYTDSSKTVKKLTLPTTTSNIGVGPLEINSKRSSSTSTDWVGSQSILMSDGTKKSIATPGAQFYYGSDGHNHFHVRDLNDMSIFNANGQKLRVAEKHGFCFEDNTAYRDWPSKGTNGAPSSPVYTPTSTPPACGAKQPSLTSVTYGLSVGWGDTYPVTLPDQYVDITGLSNGRYRVQVHADFDNNFKEVSDSNNVSWVDINLNGDTFEVVGTGGGA